MRTPEEEALLEKLQSGISDVEIINHGVDRMYELRLLLTSGEVLYILPKSVPEKESTYPYHPIENYLVVE